MKFSELKECPFCGYDEYGYKIRVTGVMKYYERFDGEECYNTEMYDSLNYKIVDNRCYCRNCGKYLGNNKTDMISKQVEKKTQGGGIDD